jgi:hypothetical protein
MANCDRKLIEMIGQENELIFQYWGKADDKPSAPLQWHLLAAIER